MSDRAVRLAGSLTGPADAPVLVLGNSLGTSRAVWDPQVPTFSEHFRLLQYDYPGHGGAPVPPGPYTIAGLAGGVLALLDDAGIARAAYCGISLGGMIGMHLAAHNPDRISALGLCCTSAYLPPASGWTERADLVLRSGMTAVSSAVVGRWFTKDFETGQPDVPAEFAAELERTDPAGYAGCCAAIAEMDLRPILPGIKAPSMVIAGMADPATPPQHAAAIAAAIPGARHVVIPDAAHLANVSNPDQVTAALLEHLLKHPQTDMTGNGP